MPTRLLAIGLIFTSNLWAQTVTYELVEGSYLGFSFVADDGEVQRLTADLRGTFLVSFNQRQEEILCTVRHWVDGDISDAAFKSISGPEYSLTGQGFFSLLASLNSSTGLPGRGGMEMGFLINGNAVGFTTEITRFRTFPRIEAGLVQSNFPPHGYGLSIIAQPMGEGAFRFFHRGDANGDARTNLTDALAILEKLLRGRVELSCEDAADANDDGQIDLTDCVTILTSLFGGAGVMPIPARLCGIDPSPDGLGCNGQAACMSG